MEEINVMLDEGAIMPIVFDDVFAAALDEIRAGLATAAAIRQQHREDEENDD